MKELETLKQIMGDAGNGRHFYARVGKSTNTIQLDWKPEFSEIIQPDAVAEALNKKCYEESGIKPSFFVDGGKVIKTRFLDDSETATLGDALLRKLKLKTHFISFNLATEEAGKPTGNIGDPNISATRKIRGQG